ncbi:MAG: sigma-70 family RNA polymerase sigma factor [Planctomycetota bacterium]|nr:sigma-70 family RNA polymerase sigma factor [Planctomycetota bacterium]MDA1250189.1 sigma-70 family RNA polymerase sigma factor [Planctomycetota bacterium]
MAKPTESSKQSGNDSTISNSLLQRVRNRDEDAWKRMMEMYGPLVHRWIRRMNVQESDAADIAQNVFQYVATKIDEFRRDTPDQSFRVWLWTVCRYRILDHYREKKLHPGGHGGSTAHHRIMNVPDLPEQPEPDDSAEGVRELAGVVRRAIAVVQGRTADNTWLAFWRTAVEGDEPNDVAEDLGVSVWTVYKARSRVISRLRGELDDLVNVESFLHPVTEPDEKPAAD